MSYKVTGHILTRNEPTVPFAILSVIDQLNKCIIIDTGSDDGTYEELQEVQKMYRNKIILEQVKLEDGQNWSNKEGQIQTKGIPESVSVALADMRRDMLKRTTTDFSFTIDSDEILPDALVHHIRRLIDKDLYGGIALFLPFMDLIHNIRTVRHYHYMARVYRTDMVAIFGNFPAEMHHNKLTGECIELYSNGAMKVENWDYPVWHFESIVKKSRKDPLVIGENPRQMPEVIVKYQDRFPRIKQFIS